MTTHSGQMRSVSGIMASMACALPYSIAAQVAYPERQCIAFVGDGGFAMLMAEFATYVKYQLPVKVIEVLDQALATSGPVLVEAEVDPLEAPFFAN
jgi:pyruvate dehydrogenase (quinone)